jgi:hypothetical protein
MLSTRVDPWDSALARSPNSEPKENGTLIFADLSDLDPIHLIGESSSAFVFR